MGLAAMRKLILPRATVGHAAICIASMLWPFITQGAGAQCEVDLLDVKASRIILEGDIALLADPTHADGIGAVFVYRNNGSEWKQEAILLSPTPSNGDSFGGSVSLSADAVVVGARDADAPEFNRGEAHVYRYDGAEWQHEAHLLASDGDGADRFGGSVAVDGDVILVGAASDEQGEVSSAGSVYVFRFDGQAWNEEKKLVPPRPASAGVFGSAVALCGEVGLIGSAGAETSFIVRYVGAPDEWEFETELIPFDGDGFSSFGTEVAVAHMGDSLLLGDAYNDGFRGRVHPFTIGTDVCCPWDIDDDDSQGFSDLLLMLSSWGPCSTARRISTVMETSIRTIWPC